MNESITFAPFGQGVSGMLKIRVNKVGRMAQPYYKSYMLRVWRDEVEGGWRATLESVTTGEVHAFAHLDQLVAFLEANDMEVLPGDNKPTGLLVS
jgi:hypothetical protein